MIGQMSKTKAGPTGDVDRYILAKLEQAELEACR